MLLLRSFEQIALDKFISSAYTIIRLGEMAELV